LIPFHEIEAFNRLTRSSMTPAEVRLIRLLDLVALQGLHKADQVANENRDPDPVSKFKTMAKKAPPR